MNSTKIAWPPSSIVLTLFGIVLIATGAFFVFIRGPLLPEDLRFVGKSAAKVDAA